MSDFPMGQDCDLDALIEWRFAEYPQRYIQGWASQVFRSCDLPPTSPAAAGLGGAGSPVPVSGLPAAPGTPNETRNT